MQLKGLIQLRQKIFLTHCKSLSPEDQKMAKDEVIEIIEKGNMAPLLRDLAALPQKPYPKLTEGMETETENIPIELEVESKSRPPSPSPLAASASTAASSLTNFAESGLAGAQSLVPVPWQVHMVQLTAMEEENDIPLQKLLAKLDEAQHQEGQIEEFKCLTDIVNHYITLGHFDAALDALEHAETKAIGDTSQLQLIFYFLIIGFWKDDIIFLRKHMQRCHQLVDKSGDWEHRNRLKVYSAVFNMRIRNFPQAAQLLLEALPTFPAEELMSFKQFVHYLVVMTPVSNPETVRQVILKVADSPHVHKVIREEDSEPQRDLLQGLAKCNYSQFFDGLVQVSRELLFDYYLHEHVGYWARETRIVAYSQYLKAYSSVSLKNMAKVFGVKESFLDSELSAYIAQGRIAYKIDKVAGTINALNTRASNSRPQQYHELLKVGDSLLTRTQKLRRVIGV